MTYTTRKHMIWIGKTYDGISCKLLRYDKEQKTRQHKLDELITYKVMTMIAIMMETKEQNLWLGRKQRKTCVEQMNNFLIIVLYHTKLLFSCSVVCETYEQDKQWAVCLLWGWDGSHKYLSRRVVDLLQVESSSTSWNYKNKLQRQVAGQSFHFGNRRESAEFVLAIEALILCYLSDLNSLPVNCSLAWRKWKENEFLVVVW